MSEPKAPHEHGGIPSSPLESDPLVGAQFGPYRIIGRIADGERGEIYFAEAPEIRRKVAVKVFREEYCRDEAALREFHAEVRIIKDLHHDGSAEIFDVGWTTDRRVYVVMERLSGETLQDRIDRGPLPFSEAAPIFGQALQVLAAHHARGVVHRDLRPDRVFLLPREGGPPRVKLLGFGVSRLVNLDDLRKRLPKLSASSGGGAVAAHYLSPEQIVNKPIDARTDIFALGILMYESFVGRLPFAGLGAVQVLAKQAQGQIPAMPDLDPALKIPPEMSDFVIKATRREPSERYQDATAMLEALTDVADARGVTVFPASQGRPRSAPVPAVRTPVPSGHSLLASPASPHGQQSISGGYPTPAPGNVGVQSAYPAMQSSPGIPAAPGYPSPAPGQPAVPYPPQGQPPYPAYDPRYVSGNYPSAANPPSGSYLPAPALPVASAPPVSTTPENPGTTPPEPAAVNTGSIRGWDAGKPQSRSWMGVVAALLVAGGVGAYFVFGGKSAPTSNPVDPAASSQPAGMLSAQEISARCLPIVRKALDDPQPQLRARAAEIVGLLRDQDRLEELARVRITDTDPKVRSKAAWALGQIGDKSVISRLKALRESADPSAQVSLNEALLRLGDEDAARQLIGFLNERDQALQGRAALALAEYGYREALPAIEKLLKAQKMPTHSILELRGALARLGSQESLEALRGALASNDPAERIAAADALDRAGFDDGYEALSYIADDTQSPYRLLAAKVLAVPGEAKVEKLFVEASFATDARVRLLAAEGMSRSGASQETISRLWSLLGDPSSDVALTAAGGLLQIQARSSDNLRASAQAWAKRGLSDTNPDVRASFARLLSLGEASAVGASLEKALADPEPQVIAAAANALGRLGRVTALAKLEPKVPQVTAEVGGALLRNGDAKGMDLLRLAFIDRREESRLAALQAAQQAKEPSFAREALADESSRVIQRAAAFSLASFGEDAGLAVLNRALGEDPASAGFARLALWELNRPEAAEFSPDKLWPSASLALRVRLVDDASRLPPKDAASLLRAGLASPDLGLRRAAMLALQSGESKLADQATRLYFLALEDIAPDIYTAAALAIARRHAAK